LDLDETSVRLDAEFAECGRERAIAQDKIANPRHSMLYEGYVRLRKSSNAIRLKCDRIFFKLRVHRRARLDQIKLVNPEGGTARRYADAVQAVVNSEGESAEEFAKLCTAVDKAREEMFGQHPVLSQKLPAERGG